MLADDDIRLRMPIGPPGTNATATERQSRFKEIFDDDDVKPAMPPNLPPRRPRFVETLDEESSEPVDTEGSVRRSKSTPGITHRLSQKLSMTFGNPTVIHRAHLHSRPSIRAVQIEGPVPQLNKQGDSANDSSDPSTPLSGSGTIPNGTKSTPPTSEEPYISPDSKYPFENALIESQFFSHETGRKLTPIREAPSFSPSIATVESAANAKVYFETYYNNIFSHADPRTQRQREFEEQLVALPLTPMEQARARNNFFNQEREYLRKCRVIKTRFHGAGRQKAVFVAGYESVKVLGKGSFGVVRLVKEKADGVGGSTGDNSSSLQQTETASVPVDLFASSRPSVERRCIRRRIMAGEKKELYAMKVIRKSEMIRNSQEGHLRAERDFLVASEKSRWVVPLISSFQDTNNLYLVMDYMIGGDFLGLLIRKNILPEEVTKWYLAEMILCIEEAHRLCWIHRDVKPDNFLISETGHLKISDFGLAFDGHWLHDQTYYHNQRYSLLKKLGIQIDGDAQDQQEAAENAAISSPDAKENGYDENYFATLPIGLLGWRNKMDRRRFARSVVGTSQYMAPEVIRGEMYDGRCDWWSIGIILYEVCMPSCKCAIQDSVNEGSAFTGLLLLPAKIGGIPRLESW